MVVIDDSRTGNNIEFVLEAIWILINLQNVAFLKMLVAALVLCFLKHSRTDVCSLDIFEAFLSKVLTDKTSTASQIKNFDLVFANPLGMLTGHLSNLLRIRVTCLVVDSLIVWCNEIKVELCILL